MMAPQSEHGGGLNDVELVEVKVDFDVLFFSFVWIVNIDIVNAMHKLDLVVITTGCSIRFFLFSSCSSCYM